MTDLETGADESTRTALVSTAAKKWQEQLSALGGPNSLLWDAGSAADQRLDLTTAHPAGMARLLSSGAVRFSELFREPAARERVLEQGRAVAHLAARLYDDFGLTSCHLAAGTASWSWAGADRTPHAPVLLRACTLRPVADDLHLVVSDRVEVNPVLVATLTALGVDLDTRAVLDAVALGSNFDPRAAYDVMRGACAGLLDFRIEPRLTVGVFSRFKLPLMRDLPDQAATLAQGHVVPALAGDPEEMDEVAAVPPDYSEHDPRDEWLAVDLDSTQQEVVDAVVAGANLCVLGAAGTGKTHTASALIASMAAQGRRVLFVAHARATIDDVQQHLAAAGLTDVMLDLGLPDRTSAQVLDHLHEVLRASSSSAEQAPALDVDVAALRARVQQHYALMHEPLDPWGVTLDEAQDQLTRLSRRTPPPRSRVRLTGDTLTGIGGTRRRQDLQQQLSSVVANGAWSTTGETDAWYGARLVGPSQTERAKELVERLAGDELATHRSRWTQLCTDLGLLAPSSLLTEEEMLELLRQVHQTLEIFQPEIFDAPLDDMVVATAGRRDRAGVEHRVGALERRRLERQARALLRPGAPPRDLHAVLARARDQRQQWRAAAGPGARPSTRTSLPELARHTEALRGDLEWLGERLADTPDGGDLIGADYDALQERLELLAAQPARLQAAAASLPTLDRLRDFGLGDLLIDLASRHVQATEAAQELEFVWWASIVDHVARTVPAYEESTGDQVRGTAQAYAAADSRHRSLGATRLRATIGGQRVAAERDLPDQVGSLERHRGRVGELLGVAPELATALAPCWAMSPLAVPSHLPSGLWFDAVIVDDASAVWTAHAIPAIARGAQLVVFGDPAGAAPAPFPTGPAARGGDVLLDRARELFPVRTLGTHYRSFDERIFGFAASRVYDEEIVTFPAADQSGGLRLDVVGEARYDAGTSPDEVERVVQVLLDQVRTRPEESVAVLAFDTRHADRIRAALRTAADDTGTAALLNASSVTTPDRAQGLVRDAVIVAVGIGRDARGRVPQRLGAVSEAGGERLVTTAMTRARRRVVVVSGVSGEDLDPSALRSRGALLLRDYLLYAASGGSGRRITRGDDASSSSASARRRRTASTGSVLDAPVAPQSSPSDLSVAVADLARRLTAEGLTVHTGHGLGDPRIDLAVEDPKRRGELLVAIETDGAAYASLPYARDRERIRPAQLRARGWSHERVLTRDLFRDPAKEVARLMRAVHAASSRRNAVPGLSPQRHDD
ncbi:DEAD/DEAH box helicase family protein [Allobranchiibius sp. CTAmp26]|uniref:DEAD/DEAH box helicase family protein n=1 Tax=Allobranchiibius sp. CTAmp26 TaxID=2815214 RepID=UPI001AA10147|nr:DEAD/DEAH box helicase family protein [Allobranchiibius sp. CTAmp26]MBO1753539.1 AAA family ATPase [Allobranchiibius sp. CTAmp26]